jgi:hypothetical protein
MTAIIIVAAILFFIVGVICFLTGLNEDKDSFKGTGGVMFIVAIVLLVCAANGSWGEKDKVQTTTTEKPKPSTYVPFSMMCIVTKVDTDGVWLGSNAFIEGQPGRTVVGDTLYFQVQLKQ